jgi:hypothetical protein
MDAPNILLTGILPSILSFLSLVRWTFMMVKHFELRHIGAVISRLLLFIMFVNVTWFNPSLSTLHGLAGTGINLLFFDEMIGWAFDRREQNVYKEEWEKLWIILKRLQSPD